MYDKVVTFQEKVNKIGCVVAGTALCFTVLLTTVEVVLRKFLGVAMGVSGEMSGYCLAIFVFWGIAYTFEQKKFLRITFIYNKFSPKIRVALDLWALILSIAFWAITYKETIAYTIDSYVYHAHSQTMLMTPLVIPQTIMCAGGILFCAQILIALWGAVREALGKAPLPEKSMEGGESDWNGQF